MASNERAEAGDLDSLMTRLGHRFAEPGRLDVALTHGSALTEAGGTRPRDYERYEFLGDRVLGLLVADMLMTCFPEEAEGSLAKRFAALVSADAIARVAREIGLGAFIRVSRGEAEAGLVNSVSVLSDVMEAVIAALYRDGGLEAARAFVEPHWRPLIDADLTPPRDPKTALQEWAQGRGLPLPRYRETAREGPAHAPVFSVAVAVEGEGEEQATGPSKREAERRAAEALLRRLEDES